jgi:hypothetical protein
VILNDTVKYVCFVIGVYILMCVIFTLSLGTEWGGNTYFPFWHWPGKLLYTMAK